MAIADEVVSGWAVREDNGKVVIWRLDDHDRAWIAHFATERWLETRSVSDQLVGRCPLVIEKVTGRVHQYGSGPDEYARFLEWLDPETA